MCLRVAFGRLGSVGYNAAQWRELLGTGQVSLLSAPATRSRSLGRCGVFDVGVTRIDPVSALIGLWAGMTPMVNYRGG